MDFDWHEPKRISNLTKHGIDFERAVDFEWETALVLEDTRKNYGEPRFPLLECWMVAPA